MPFLQSASGNPINTAVRVAPQAARGVPPLEAAWKDGRVYGAPFAVTANEIVRQNINTTGAPQTNIQGKRAVPAFSLPLGDVDASNIIFLRGLANFFGKYAYTDNTTSQVYHFGLNQATSAPGYLAWLVDNDVLPRMRFTDGLIGGLQIGATPNGNFAATFTNCVVGQYDMYGAINQTVGSGDPWQVRNTYAEQMTDADATDKDLYVKRISKSSTTWSLQAKLAAAGSYGATFTVTEGLDSAGYPIYTDIQVGTPNALIRDWAENPQIHIPSGATAVDLDINKWTKRRAAWSQSLDPERPISSVETRFLINDELVRIEGGFQVNAAWQTNAALEQVSFRQGATTDRSGAMMVTVTPTRRITDMRLQTAIHEGSTVKMVIDAKTSSNITGAIRPYRVLMVLPAVKLHGNAMFSTAAGGQNKDEAPVGHAGVPLTTYTYDSIACASHFHMIVENDVTTSEW